MSFKRFCIHNKRMGKFMMGRHFCDKNPASNNLSWAFASLPESLRWAAAIGSCGLIIAILPVLPETKRGFREALNSKHRKATTGPWWGWMFGSLGFVGAYSGTSAYLTRIGQTNPVLAGFKTPFALFGAVLGGKLCHDLSPLMFDASGIVSRLATFTLDGLIADTIGRPDNQPAAWHDDVSFISKILGEPAVGDFDHLQEHPPRSSAVQAQGNASDSASLGMPTDPCNQIMIEAAAALLALRRREASLRVAQMAAAAGRDRESMQPQLRAVVADKAALKAKTLAQCGQRISRFADGKLRKAADELTRLRLQQVALGRELGLIGNATGMAGSRRRAIEQQLQQLEREKKALKRDAQATFGVQLTRIARSAPSWRAAEREARGR